MQFKPYSVVHLFRQWHVIEFACTLVCEFSQIVSFKFYSIQFVYSSQFFYFLLSLLTWHWVFSVFIACKLVE